MASEAMQALVTKMKAIRRARGEKSLSIKDMRAGFEAQQARLVLPDDISRTELSLGGRAACRISPPGIIDGRVVLYLHGGGYVMGSLNSHQELMGRLSRVLKANVYGLDYRLAPEHPWPCALEDASMAWGDMLKLGVKPENIIVAGDSAGGGLTMSLLLALKAAGESLPCGAVVFSPWVDLTCKGASYETRADVDPMMRPETLRSTAHIYCGDNSPTTPTISPIFGDLSGLPPLFIQVGDAEVLLDDAVRLHEISQKAGTESTLQIYEGAVHAFQAMPVVPEAAEALQAVSVFCESVWA